MAQPHKQAQTSPSPRPADPEVRAYAIVHTGPAMWARREYLIQGDRVLAFTDAVSDAKAPTIGYIVRQLERAE
jgi:hypothetical protein